MRATKNNSVEIAAARSLISDFVVSPPYLSIDSSQMIHVQKSCPSLRRDNGSAATCCQEKAEKFVAKGIVWSSSEIKRILCYKFRVFIFYHTLFFKAEIKASSIFVARKKKLRNFTERKSFGVR
ncbi:hypothetical protein CDAR_41221 [Caerostris darwini]|uniref:Uncharacterized protein n=1 Tax=Caerostris darwini TaxID=1538125 RepID=A0AAV4SHH8_9ARAC|nr:hypothetical protein CDAR_41221 [Caerostris darwini]